MGKAWGLAFLLLSVVGCAATRPPAPSAAPVPGGVLFRIAAPAAARVSVVGNFNNWDPAATPLSDSTGDGAWERILRLPPGRYQYMFLVDGKWITPPNAPHIVQDGFGRQNGLLIVE